MAQKDISPEKRLLQIIEGKEGNKPAPGALDKGKEILSPGTFKARLSFFVEKFRKGKGKKKGVLLELKTVNLLLKLLIVASIAGLTLSVKVEYDILTKQKLIVTAEFEADVQAAPIEIASLLKTQSYYLEKAQVRDLFSFGDTGAKKVVVFDKADEGPTELENMTQNLRLVGISWSDKPDAIIEDEKLDKTYFVQKGQKIEGIRVKDILKDRVILRYKGDEVELR